MLTHHIGCGWKILADLQDCGVWSEGAHFTCFTSTKVQIFTRSGLRRVVRRCSLTCFTSTKVQILTRLSTPSWQTACTNTSRTYADVSSRILTYPHLCCRMLTWQTACTSTSRTKRSIRYTTTTAARFSFNTTLAELSMLCVS